MNAETQAGADVLSAIEAQLRDAFSPVHLSVKDESSRHAGHAGWREGGATHLRVTMESALFTGKSRIERHRMVNTVLGGFLKSRVHALALHLFAPGEK